MYISHCTSSSNHPSFSSTLLDSVYRSFDLAEEEMGIYREPIDKNSRTEEEMARFQRVCKIEKLMEKRLLDADKGRVPRRKCAETEFPEKMWRKGGGGFSFSSDSSFGGGDADEGSFPGGSPRRPKPIRTGCSGHNPTEKCRENFQEFKMLLRERGFADQTEAKQSKHNGGGFLNTKSRALKIYADLKKVKQPISPGRKLATFLNSLFTNSASAGSSKKQKSDADRHHSPASKSANTSTCSSASSFSRSCLSKPSPSTGKLPGTAKASVIFPARSVTVNHENKPIHTTLYSELLKNNNSLNNNKSTIDEELMTYVMEYNRRVEDAATDFRRKTHFPNRVWDQESEEDDDDMESCASSDLFELDNLSTIGVAEKYRKELPVYETTNADAKQAIMN